MNLFKAFLTTVVLGAALLVVGCGSSSPSAVSPAAYVKSVCQTIGPFEKQVQASRTALNATHITTATQGKQALQTFLGAVVGQTNSAVSKLRTAGTPNVTNGKKIASAIVGTFSTLQSALNTAVSQAKQLPTSSPQAFKAAAQTLGTNVQSSVSGIGSSLNGLKSADLEKAAAKEPACQNVG